MAIARALVTRPDVIFADEPTGALDTTTAAEILALLRTAVDAQGATVVMVTHDPLPLRGAGAPASLAAANSRTNARRLASAITPIVLAMAFSSVLVFLHTSEDRAIERQQHAGILADHIVTADPGLTPDAVRQAARTPEVTAAVGLLKTSVLVPASGGGLTQASAQGVTGSARELAAVQDLDVKKGRCP